MIRSSNVEAVQEWGIPSKKVFVVESDLSDQGYEMLGKMVAALKFKPHEVSFVEDSEDLLTNLENLSDSKNILFFGETFPGHFGEIQNWFGHQVIQTHSMDRLLAKPNAKKATWAHLKTYAGLK